MRFYSLKLITTILILRVHAQNNFFDSYFSLTFKTSDSVEYAEASTDSSLVFPNETLDASDEKPIDCVIIGNWIEDFANLTTCCDSGNLIVCDTAHRITEM